MTEQADSNVSEFYHGVEAIAKDAKDTRKHIKRYARLSLELEVSSQLVNEAIVDTLTLKQGQKYSRSTIDFSGYVLGRLTFDRKKHENPIFRGKLSSERSVLQNIGLGLVAIISPFETPPVDENARREWEKKSFDSENTPLVPVAIYGVDYFSKIVDLKGSAFAPEGLVIYRTNDEQSRKLLEDLRD